MTIPQQPGLANGVVAHSKPNVAAAAMPQDLVTLGQVTLTPFGEISTGPGVKSFDLSSFYFGCVTNLENSLVTTSTGCTIAVTGYKYNGQQVPEATFAFAPAQTIGAPPALASLPSSYVGLKNVTIGIASAAVLAAETIVDIDDLVHCNYS